MANPLRDVRSSARRPPEPCTIVVLGATGDLAARKLFPALYNLTRNGYMPPRHAIVGFARRPKSDEEFRSDVFEALSSHSRTTPRSRAEADDFLGHVHYQQGQLDSTEDFAGLGKRLDALEAELNLPANRLFYFAISPEFFDDVVFAMRDASLHQPSRDNAWVRIIIEKPFGNDLESARVLNRKVQSVFHESQVYRIDHYLGKETVQDIMAFRFANSIFEPVWSSRYIDHVQITMSEDVGMPGRRGQYFDTAGILRDVVQNHVLQLLCLTAMEPPASMEADSLRDEKVRVLRAIGTFGVEDVRRNVVRGQYAAGSLHGKDVPAYRSENLIPEDSTTETYVAIRFAIRNWRWAGVPFLLRAGKRLAKRATEIAVTFKRPPHEIFPTDEEFRKPNTITIRIQPDEGISLTFAAKQPGLGMNLQPVQMDFRYGTSFGESSPEAYERLILDSMVGDGSLFTRSDEVEEAWRLCTSILDGWQELPPPTFPNYEAGSWGPEEAERLTDGLMTQWRRL